MNDFMKDRYGVDELTVLLGGVGVLLALIGSLSELDVLLWASLAVVLIALIRAFSKNLDARRREDDAFRAFSAHIPGLRALVARLGDAVGADAGRRRAGSAPGATGRADFDRARRTAARMWRDRKTSRFLKCPSCGQILSVPKGKGKIRVTCPKCHAKMETKS